MKTRFTISNNIDGFYYVYDSKFDEYSNEMFTSKKNCREFIKELQKLSDTELYRNDKYFVNDSTKTNIYKY